MNTSSVNCNPTQGKTENLSTRSGLISVILTGDLVLDVDNCDHYLSGIAAQTRAADLTIGHLEVPHTNRGIEMEGDIPAPGADPKNLEALQGAGFDLLSLAGNHMADRGRVGILDTANKLDELGIGYCGAGDDLAAARRPVRKTVGGFTVSLLSYNCIGPQTGWAKQDGPKNGRSGCAYLPMKTKDGGAVTPLSDITGPTQNALDILANDLDQLRSYADYRSDLIIVALHKGIVHTPAIVADYERATAKAAIDAGADIVIGHHAHIIRGIEFYKGKPIFHGLGNGCVVTNALSPGQDHAARADWVERRKEMFGFEPDPAYTLAPFHPQAVNAMLGKITISKAGDIKTGIVPVHIEAPGRPVIANEKQAKMICDYLEKITRDAGLAPIKTRQSERMIEVLPA